MSEQELQRQIDELKAENERLRRQILARPATVGPRQETPDEIKERADRMVEEIRKAIPPVDRSKLCTTDGRPVAEARASQTNETGQHPSYIVLCDEERAKGFVRPYRDRYKHVGRSICLRNRAASDGFLTVCDDTTGHDGECFIVSRTMTVREHQQALDAGYRLGGCGTVTTMGRALSETYARDPSFYGATFCCGCNRHLPVAEFVWSADGQPVGS